MGSTPHRAVCPTSTQTPIRSSYFWMASQTSKGEGQTLSSGPWLWMASLISNSLTSLSRTGSDSRVGLQTMVGMPASRAYSNALRSWDSSSVMLITPQLRGVMPASRNFSTTALRSLGGALERQVGVLDRDVIDADASDALDGGLQGQPAVAVRGHAHLQPQPGVGAGSGQPGATAGEARPDERRRRGGRGGEADESPARKRGE